MADLKITDLGAALSVGDSNVTVLDDGTSTMKVTMNQLKEYSIGTTDISGIGNGTPTGAISSVNTSKNNVRDSIAPTETSTASRAYEVDEKMYISDVLYKATRAIALGDSLVSGTNITPANDVSTEILELKSDASEAIDSVKNIIAPVEDGGTAVLSYSAGDQFIHLGALCKAKTTINAGDTFIINTNYEDAGQVVDQFDSVKQALSNEVATRATLGAHNLFKFPTLAEIKARNTSGSWNDNVYSWGKATFTINSDDTITINCDGTGSNSSVYLVLYNRLSAKYYMDDGNYIINGLISSDANKFSLAINATTKNATTEAWGVTTTDLIGSAFTVNNSQIDGLGVSIPVFNNFVVDNVVVKPQIRLASDPSTKFTPYAMTNQQLTNDIVVERYDSGVVSQTINANESYELNVSVAKDGYKPSGIVGIFKYGSGNSAAIPYEFYIASNNAHVSFKNVTSSAVTITRFYLDILYKKN